MSSPDQRDPDFNLQDQLLLQFRFGSKTPPVDRTTPKDLAFVAQIHEETEQILREIRAEKLAEQQATRRLLKKYGSGLALISLSLPFQAAYWLAGIQEAVWPSAIFSLLGAAIVFFPSKPTRKK